MAGVSAVIGLLVFVIAHHLIGSSSALKDYSKEKESAYWHDLAHKELKKSLDNGPILGRAKNVIMFIGDGMGPTSVTAGRILAGQMEGLKGEDHRLSFDNLPHTGLAVTYNVDTQITDSAASATAYTSGVKTNQGILGMNAMAQLGNCTTSKGTEVDSILRWFLDSGRAGGVVTTTTVTHATPGATYAHTPHRNWEVDTGMPQEAIDASCKDIARQLIEDNPDINVIMGGGMNNFKPSSYVHPRPDKEPWRKNVTKGRNDSRDLTHEWQVKKKAEKLLHKFVSTKEEFDKLNANEIDYLFGLFAEFSMAYEIERNDSFEPSLAEMTEKAIQVLKRNDNGYFLMVEGGRIDHGHHASQPSKALHDVVALSNAVQKALDLTDKSETLILVTADHSHTMSIAGYALRGNPILEESISPKNGVPTDKKPYTTLLYADGPGYSDTRQNITDIDTTDKDYISQSAVPLKIETHGGEDVAMYAQGPQAHLYSGVHENTYIPMLMAYAACVGPYSKDCAASKPNTSPSLQLPHLAVLVSLLLFIEFIRRH